MVPSSTWKQMTISCPQRLKKKKTASPRERPFLSWLASDAQVNCYLRPVESSCFRLKSHKSVLVNVNYYFSEFVTNRELAELRCSY
jgi:hypothetical protein